MTIHWLIGKYLGEIKAYVHFAKMLAFSKLQNKVAANLKCFTGLLQMTWVGNIVMHYIGSIMKIRATNLLYLPIKQDITLAILAYVAVGLSIIYWE